MLCLIRNPNVCLFILSSCSCGLRSSKKRWRQSSKQDWQCPAKGWGAVMQHRKTTEQVWVMTLTNSIFDLHSVFLIIVIFFRFIVVFPNVSALYKCSVCFSRKSQNKQAKKPSQKYNPKAGNYILGVGTAKLLFPALCSEGRKQTKAVPLWPFLWPCQHNQSLAEGTHTRAGLHQPGLHWAHAPWQLRTQVGTARLPHPRKGLVVKGR